MLNFDNSTARERLARNYTGAVDFGMGDFESASYLYSPKDYTIGGDTDYGALKIYDSDKYTIKTPQFKSAYHMAELVSSPLPDVPHTKKSQFDDGADLNNFLSVPKDDLVLENYVGQEAQAEGIRSEEEFFVSQARKEVAESNLNDLDKFMKSPEIEDLVTYKPSKGGKVYTQTERQAEHKAARKKNKSLPLGKSDNKGKILPNVKPAFDAVDPLFGEPVVGQITKNKISKETIKKSQTNNKEKEKLQRKAEEYESFPNKYFDVKRDNIKKSQKESIHNQNLVVDKIGETIQRENEARFKDEVEAKQLQEQNIQKYNEIQKTKATITEKITKLQKERLNHQNGVKSEKEEGKSEKKEEGKSEKKESKEESQSEKETFELGSEFNSTEKRTIKKLISNLGFSMSENIKELKEKLNVFLKREYNERINGNNSNTNFFKKLFAIMERRIEEKRDDNSDNDLPELIFSPQRRYSFVKHLSKKKPLRDQFKGVFPDDGNNLGGGTG